MKVRGVFFQLDDEIDKMLALDGMKRKEHVLELSRLMVRAENPDHRLSLLKLIQVSLLANYTNNLFKILVIFPEVSLMMCGFILVIILFRTRKNLPV